jgi:hypothetical protein
MDDRSHRIREEAYRLWEAEGRPEGRAGAHWDMAEKLISAEDLQISGPDPDPEPSDPKAATPQPPGVAPHAMAAQ